MKKISYRPYVLLLASLFSLMSLSEGASEKIRSIAVCSLTPCWRGLHLAKEKMVMLLTLPTVTGNPPPAVVEELEQLKQENVMLRSQIEHVREYLLLEDRIAQQMERMRVLTTKPLNEPKLKDVIVRKNQELCAHLDLYMQAVSAQVVFREPCSWSSSVWIDVGERQNQAIGKQVIAKNSPVLVGSSIIGVIEYVGVSRSRVRLITDARLTSAVRAVRGGEQNRYLLEHLDPLLFALEVREDLKGVAGQLAQLRQKLDPEAQEQYLAKGELSGASRPLWRTRGQVLKGIGFNYDFADQEGPARDLRSGSPYEKGRTQEATSLLKLGDLLVTTGLDGVFPAGFRVAIVSKVQRLKEGASSYEIEAVSTAGNLDELNYVFVLPPLNLSK